MNFTKKGASSFLIVVLAFFSVVLLSFLAGKLNLDQEILSKITNLEPVGKILGTTEEDKTPEEIKVIRKSNDQKRRAQEYDKLIKRVGPQLAQEELYKSGVPFDGESHLINHTVGDFLYKTNGTEGLSQCKDYFLSSCYHGFLIPFIAENGIEKLNNAMDVCWKSGHSTAVQCAHGIGHGLLAFHGYINLPKALESCDRVAEISKNFPLYNCHDGVFMENNFAVHDNGEPSPDRWIDFNDPEFPCNDPRIGEKYTKACWANQPQMLFKDFYAGDVREVASVCQEISNPEYQYICFDSIARQIQPMTRNNIDEVFRLCSMLPEEKWQNECIYSVVRAYFSVGDKSLPFAICEELPTEKQPACFRSLTEVIKGYHPNLIDRRRMCDKIPFRPVWEYCMSG